MIDKTQKTTHLLDGGLEHGPKRGDCLFNLKIACYKVRRGYFQHRRRKQVPRPYNGKTRLGLRLLLHSARPLRLLLQLQLLQRLFQLQRKGVSDVNSIVSDT